MRGRRAVRQEDAHIRYDDPGLCLRTERAQCWTDGEVLSSKAEWLTAVWRVKVVVWPTVCTHGRGQLMARELG